MTTAPDLTELAGELRLAVGQLVRRYRADGPLPQPQLAVLSWLLRKGPKTTSQLAAVEHVRPQSMAHTVGELEAAGHVERRPDPADGRQMLIALTAGGRVVMDGYQRAGATWMTDLMATRLNAGEQAELARGVALLTRLMADEADPR